MRLSQPTGLHNEPYATFVFEDRKGTGKPFHASLIPWIMKLVSRFSAKMFHSSRVAGGISHAFSRRAFRLVVVAHFLLVSLAFGVVGFVSGASSLDAFMSCAFGRRILHGLRIRCAASGLGDSHEVRGRTHTPCDRVLAQWRSLAETGRMSPGWLLDHSRRTCLFAGAAARTRSGCGAAKL